MTDPERISRRSSGLAAELLRAGAGEEPSAASIEHTLLALGATSAVLTTAGVASASVASGAAQGAAAAGGAKAVKAVTALMLAKWIGVGVVGGVGLAGAAAVMSGPAAPVASAPLAVSSAAVPRRAPVPATVPVAAQPTPAEAVVPAPEVAAPSAVTTRPSVTEAVPAPAVDVGAPLAAEVAYVDRARGLLSSGQTEQGLSLLAGYEKEFSQARLLPEVLFLQLESYDGLGRKAQARAAAQRLVDGFPTSPHAGRARRLLDFP